MTNHPFVIVGSIAAALLLGCRTGSSVDEAVAGRFTPPAGKTLLIVGQDLESVAGYAESIPLAPAGVTTYTDISEGRHATLLYGLEDTVDYGAGYVSARALVDHYPQSALVVGLYLVDHTGTNLSHIADGTHDEAVDRLGRFIASADRPVFLRIGYEFDGAWNHYEPEAYVAALRHIVDRLHESGVENVATVWQSATSVWGTYKGLGVEAWYPGDEYVDWMGMSYFIHDAAIFDRLLSFARARSKPVMIAESAPQGYDLEEVTFSAPSDGTVFEPRTADAIWDEWFAPFMAFVHENSDVVRAVAYINCDWNQQEMWRPGGPNGYWGDSRVQANESIRKRWIAEMRDARWLHGSADLSRALGHGS